MRVDFESEFEQHPQVAIAAASLAWEAGDNEFDAKVSEVSRDGFLITFVARSEK